MNNYVTTNINNGLIEKLKSLEDQSLINLKEKILSQSLAIRTKVLPEVLSVIDHVLPNFDSVQEYKTEIIKWLSPVIDLSDFHIYPTNGITDGLNWWIGTTPYNITRADNEYQWVDNITTRLAPHTIYQSIPSAIDGNYKGIISYDSIALDLAYVGSARIKKIEISKNVNHVFFSLSKPFGVRNIRTGWYFTRTPDRKLENLVYGAKYYNYYANAIAETIISNFDIDYVHRRLSIMQHDVCKKLEFNPSDTVWLATTGNIEYAKFRRDNNTARICLSGVYEIC